MRGTPTASTVSLGHSNHKGGKRDAFGLTTKGSGLSVILCLIICIVIVLTAVFHSAGQSPVPSREHPDLSGLATITDDVMGSKETGKMASEASTGIEGVMANLQGGKLAQLAQQFIGVFDDYVKSIADDSADDAIDKFKKEASKGLVVPFTPSGEAAPAGAKLGAAYFTGRCTGCPASWYQKCTDAPGGKATDQVLGHRGCDTLGCELQCRKVVDVGPTKPPTPAPPTPPTSTPTQQPTIQGKCTNAKDFAVWQSKGKAQMGTEMTKIGFKCMGGDSCMALSIDKDFGYSPACGKCFGDLGACTKKECMFKCMGGVSKGCTKCTRKNCVGGFSTCSGIPKSEVPK